MAATVNSGLYDAMLQIAKFENIVDHLQLAQFAGYKTKPSVSVILASFR